MNLRSTKTTTSPSTTLTTEDSSTEGDEVDVSVASNQSRRRKQTDPHQVLKKIKLLRTIFFLENIFFNFETPLYPAEEHFQFPCVESIFAARFLIF